MRIWINTRWPDRIEILWLSYYLFSHWYPIHERQTVGRTDCRDLWNGLMWLFACCKPVTRVLTSSSHRCHVTWRRNAVASFFTLVAMLLPVDSDCCNRHYRWCVAQRKRWSQRRWVKIGPISSTVPFTGAAVRVTGSVRSWRFWQIACRFCRHVVIRCRPWSCHLMMVVWSHPHLNTSDDSGMHALLNKRSTASSVYGCQTCYISASFTVIAAPWLGPPTN